MQPVDQVPHQGVPISDTDRKEWNNWCKANINPQASTVEGVFANFRRVIQVDPQKFFVPSTSHDEAFWVPMTSFHQFAFPQRSLEDSALWAWFSGRHTQEGFVINALGKVYNCVFVATNNEQAALMISLMFGK